MESHSYLRMDWMLVTSDGDSFPSSYFKGALILLLGSFAYCVCCSAVDMGPQRTLWTKCEGLKWEYGAALLAEADSQLTQ